MGLRPAASIEGGGDDLAQETEGAPVERLDERRADRDEGGP